MKLYRRFLELFAPSAGAARDLFFLRRKYAKELRHLDWMLETQMGQCCPDCSIPGYADLGDQQDRRLLQIRILEAKMNGDDAAKRKALASLNEMLMRYHPDNHLSKRELQMRQMRMNQRHYQRPW